MNQTAASNLTHEDPKDNEVSRSSSVMFTCATIIVSVGIISVTVIALVLVMVKKKRRIAIERERNELYGTYDNGPEYNIVTDENMYYQ